jgi:ABC-type multidrug transport system ATPase subunit
MATAQIIVIASIHQPAASTFALFDRLVLLASGRTCYSGPVTGVSAHFAQIGHPMPTRTSPAEFLLELVNADFARDPAEAEARVADIHTAWAVCEATEAPARVGVPSYYIEDLAEAAAAASLTARLSVPLTLLHRNFIKSYRDVVAYGIRIAMYFGQSGFLLRSRSCSRAVQDLHL